MKPSYQHLPKGAARSAQSAFGPQTLGSSAAHYKGRHWTCCGRLRSVDRADIARDRACWRPTRSRTKTPRPCSYWEAIQASTQRRRRNIIAGSAELRPGPSNPPVRGTSVRGAPRFTWSERFIEKRIWNFALGPSRRTSKAKRSQRGPALGPFLLACGNRAGMALRRPLLPSPFGCGWKDLGDASVIDAKRAHARRHGGAAAPAASKLTRRPGAGRAACRA
jgi:hypothetical protein